MNPGTPHIIAGFAEALAAPEVVWSLRDSGFEVTVANRRGRRTALHHSRAASILDVTPPEQDLAACVGELIGAAEARGAMLMPVDDACVAVCAQIAEQRSAPIVIGPRGRQADLALDKRKQIDAAQHSGLLVPPTEVVQTISELRNAVAEFAVVLKDANAMRIDGGRLARGRSFVCANPDELAVAEEAWGEGYTLIVQPLLAGVGEGLFGVRLAGETLALSAHRRIRMMNPQGSGSSACKSVPVDPGLVAAATRFLESADWDGLFMLEFLRDRAGRAWFMELNGRAWGSMALALRIGLDYPAWAARGALDPAFKPAVPPPRPDVVCRHLGREIVHFLFSLRGPTSSANVDWPRPLATLGKLLRVRRGDRWYNWRRDDWQVFVSDTFGTVASQVRRRGG